jgi:hypothetical protein
VHILPRQEADLAVPDRRHLPFGVEDMSEGALRPYGCMYRTHRPHPQLERGLGAPENLRWQLGVLRHL